MPPILLCWSTASEAVVGHTAVDVEPSHLYSWHFVAMQQMAAEVQPDRMTSDMEVCMKQRGEKERNLISPWGKKLHPLIFTDTCWMFMEIKQWMSAQWSSWVFWNPDQTINSDHYITVLTELKVQTSRVRPEKKTTFLLQHDYTMPRSSLKTRDYAANFGWPIYPYPLYSLTLVTSDFHLFGKMKDRLCGQHFPTNNVIIAAVKLGHLHWCSFGGFGFLFF